MFSAKRKSYLLLLCSLSIFLSAHIPTWAGQDDIRFLTQVMRIVKNNYVREVGEAELMQLAVEGLVKSVDPYAAYLTSDLLPEYEKRLSRPFGVLGLALALDDGLLTVVSVADGSPAAKAGIEPKDKIIKIDNVTTKGMTLMDAWKKLKNAPGDKVNLNVAKQKSQRIKTYTVKKEGFKFEPITAKLIDKHYLYIRIADFQEDTDTLLAGALGKYQHNDQIRGVVIDLRNNPGGVLDKTLKSLSLFLDKNPVGFAERRSAKKEELLAGKNGKHFTGNVAVLINEGTAGTSELFAGALQDYDRALLFGSQSFGRASIQNIIPISNGANISITTAYLHTPKGKNIYKNGISPDIETKANDEEKSKSNHSTELKLDDPENDILVKSALEWLKSGKKVAESRPEPKKE